MPTEVIYDPPNLSGLHMFHAVYYPETKVAAIEMLETSSGHGVGRQAYEHFEQWARQQGAERIELLAWLSAIGFWRKMGFKKNTEFNRKWHDQLEGGDTYMVKKLPRSKSNRAESTSLKEMAAADFKSINLRAKYDEFNAKYFGGQLPSVPLSWNRSKWTTGVTRGRVIRHPITRRAEGPVYDLSVEMSTLVGYESEDFDVFLLHEMIHVYLLVKGVGIDAGTDHKHGFEFKQEAARIGSLLGREIPLFHNLNSVSNINASIKEVGFIQVHHPRGLHYVVFRMKPETLSDWVRKAAQIASSYRCRVDIYRSLTNLWATLPLTTRPDVKNFRLTKLSIDPSVLLKDAVLLQTIDAASPVHEAYLPLGIHFWVHGEKVSRIAHDSDHGEWIAQHLTNAPGVRQLAQELEALGEFDTSKGEESTEAHYKVREGLIDAGLRRGLIRGRIAYGKMWLHAQHKMDTRKLSNTVHLVMSALDIQSISSVIWDWGLSDVRGGSHSDEISYRDLMSEEHPQPTWNSLLKAKLSRRE